MKAGRMYFVWLCWLVFAVSVVHAGSIQGTVYDEKSGEELVGANVWVIDTTRGAATDLEGTFRIDNLNQGSYDVRISFMGYGAMTITGIAVEDDRPVVLDVSLVREAIQVEEVVVSAERILSSAAAVIARRKKAAAIGDGISSEQISQSPDGTSGDALKRVTGLSVVDNRYVFVRGVTDRYNETMLNGVNVTGTDTDVDKKSFNFDLVPANLLENTVIVKTATPDMPGSFSGGLVKVNTLDFPDERLVKLSFSSSYNRGTSTKSIFASHGGGTDWLGLDDGGRDFPDADLKNTELIDALPNNWTTRSVKAPLNRSFSLSAGDNLTFAGHELGVISALSYKSGYRAQDFVQKSKYPYIDFEGKDYKYSVLWGAILNLNYKPNHLHKMSFENSFNQRGQDNIRVSEGIPESSAPTRRQTIEWDECSQFAGKLTGEHRIPQLHDLEVNWGVSHSLSQSKEPDRRNIEYQQGADRTWGMIENYRSWSSLDDRVWGANTDFTLPLGDTEIKAGWGTTLRRRTFDIKVYFSDMMKIDWRNWYIVTLPLDSIFDPSNYGAGKFQFVPMTQYTGEYDGVHRVNAGYTMIDLPFRISGQRFRLVGGTRIEESNQDVDATTANPLNPSSSADIKKTDVLPSANLTYLVTDDVNLRIAYSRSVNRPGFREMADVKYYDFDEFQNVIGNPKLERATIENYDVRFEVFPGVGDVVAVSYFYKKIEDAIEIRLIPEPTRWVRTWFNSPNGTNHGWEIEVRKSFGFITPYLANFLFTGNYTRVESAIEYVDKKTAQDGSPIIRTLTRPMQGQSPWMANASLLFAEPSFGTTINILYNKIGRRLASVGDNRFLDVYEEPRDVWDVALTQELPGRLNLKFTANDLGAHDEKFTMGPDGWERAPDYYGNVSTDPEPHSQIRRGTTYSISVSASL
jgi:outer membrane receptor protein involved in Fe transport